MVSFPQVFPPKSCIHVFSPPYTLHNQLISFFLILSPKKYLFRSVDHECRSQWPRGLRRRSAAARLLGLRVRIPLEHGCLPVVSVLCCQWRSLRRTDHSSRGVLPTVVRRCVCYVVCDLETSRMRRPRPRLGRSATGGKKVIITSLCRIFHSSS